MTSQNVVPLKAGGPILGIVPQNIDEIFRLATGIAKSGLAPADMSTPEKVMVAIMTGLELGLPPMFAIQKIAVINGRPSLWGDAIPALLYAKGFKISERLEGEGDKRVAVCEVMRPTGEKIERRFSVADAQKAGLWQTSAKVKRKSKDGGFYEKDNDSPWYRFPDRMLQMRARGFAARDGAADVLGGMYLREELDEPEMKDVTPATSDTSLPSLPEIPDIQDLPDISDAPVLEEDEPIADVDGFLVKLEEDRSLCDSEDDVRELALANEDIIARLPDDAKAKALALLEVDA
jgi:hypothetical protein